MNPHSPAARFRPQQTPPRPLTPRANRDAGTEKRSGTLRVPRSGRSSEGIVTGRLGAAMEWLDAHVPHGSRVEAGVTITAAVGAGHAVTTLRRARWRLRIESPQGTPSCQRPVRSGSR